MMTFTKTSTPGASVTNYDVYVDGDYVVTVARSMHDGLWYGVGFGWQKYATRRQAATYAVRQARREDARRAA